MADLDVIFKDIVERLLTSKTTYYDGTSECLVDKIFKKNDNETIEEYISRKTPEEILAKMIEYNHFAKYRHSYSIYIENLFNDAYKLEQRMHYDKTSKEIAAIKEHIQNTADIVNLFTDIDKNRTNLEEQNKQVNNRLDKLEASINQILSLLQKIDF